MKDSNVSVPFKIGTLGPHTVLSIAISGPVVFSWVSLTAWNCFLSKMILVLGKARSYREPNLGCGGLSHLHDLMFRQKTAQDVMHEQACCCDEAANHQAPISVAFWIIQIVFTEECSSLMQNLMQTHCYTRSVILNVMATQYTCSLNSKCHSHWLVQWSRHCSHMQIPVHSPWLPGYINIAQTFLIILSVVELYPDRPIDFVSVEKPD